MAQFPSSVATDSNLYVAVNTLATTLVGALTSSGGNYSPTEIQVADTSGFPSVGFITIDTEAISYSGLAATPPRFTGISRGADGTIAAAHLSGVATKHNVIAAHHNVLKEEIKAIEQNISDRLGLSSTQNIIPLGSVSAPSLTFVGDLNTGLYRFGADNIGFAAAGVNMLQLTSDAVYPIKPIWNNAGTISTPSYSFDGDINTGLYWNSADKFSIVCGGNDRMTFETGSGLGISCWALFRATDGTAASPSISFINDINTGLYSYNGTLSDAVRAVSNGVEVFEWRNYSPGFTHLKLLTGQLLVPDGSVTYPSIAFTSDNDGTGTGIYRVSTDNIGFSAAGSLRLTLGTSGFLLNDVARVNDGSLSAPAYSFQSNTDCGMYLNASDLNFVTNGSTGFSVQPNYVIHSRDTIPAADNTFTLGKTGSRWTAVWAVNGTIQTSHSSTKTDILELPEDIEVPKGISFKRPGEDKIHLGFLADSLPKEAFFDEVNIETSSVIGVLCAAVRKLQAKVQALESKEI